jgi:hypothetical protein
MTDPTRRFVFSPLERRGLLLGLTPPQLASLAGGVVVALVVVHLSPDVLGIVAAMVVLVTGVTGACLPLAGRAPVVWLPVALRWARQRVGGPSLARGRRAGPRRSAVLDGTVDIFAAPAAPGQPTMAVLRDRTSGTWASVIPVRGRAFALLDPGDKTRRLAAWGAVLAGLARTGTPVHRLQWVERSFAGDGDALRRHLLDVAPPPPGNGSPAADTVEAAARRGYEELIATAGPATLEHETLIVLAVHPRRAARSLRSFGLGRDAICGLLQRETRLLQGQLRAAELGAGDPLDPAEISLALRSGFDPGIRQRHRPPGWGRMAAGAWPLASDEAWASLRLDGAWFATFWVAEWPRVEVGPDFLVPLLLAGARRTVSVTLAPVPPDRARREVEAARTADAADDELRRRAGFLATARRRRETDGVLQREAELADGHGEYAFSGYVTVSGPDRVGLETACAEIEQAAQQARVDLRRLYGQQREAFCWTLPLARGLA